MLTGAPFREHNWKVDNRRPFTKFLASVEPHLAKTIEQGECAEYVSKAQLPRFKVKSELRRLMDQRAGATHRHSSDVLPIAI